MRTLTKKFLLATFLALSMEASAKASMVTMTLRNVTVKDAIVDLQKNTGYSVVIYAKDVDMNRRVNVEARNEKVANVVGKILAGQNVSYEINGKTIVVSQPKGVPSESARTQKGDDKKQRVKGNVVDEQGQPIIGASVVDKATNTGAVTDLDGNFVLDVPIGTELTISYVGFADYKLRAAQNMNVQLRPDTQLLSDVVVVGYGSQKKVDVTGSIASVTGKDIARSPMANLTNSIGGKLAGLRVVQRSGEPGKDGSDIDIRGYGTALVVVDGVPSSFDQIDPNEIESITILKDASAAVYGIRAANGVVLVTTKRGGSQATKIELNSTFSWQRPTIYPELCNAAQFVELTDEDLVNRGKQRSRKVREMACRRPGLRKHRLVQRGGKALGSATAIQPQRARRNRQGPLFCLVGLSQRGWHLAFQQFEFPAF